MERKLSAQMARFDVVTDKIGQLGQWASTHPWQGYSGQWMAASNEFGQRVLVMNPMHIVHLSSNTKSKLVRVIEFCKSFTEKWFSHLLLLVILILYTCLGAWMFMVIEGRVEYRIKAPVINMRDKIKREMWYFTTMTNITQDHLNKIIEYQLTQFEEQLYENFKSGAVTSVGESSIISWSFLASIVYCFTVFTTIGYGHIAPRTKMGRIVTIIYACVGIPLLLMVLADLGKLFTRTIKHFLRKIRKILHAKKLKQVRSAGRRATIVQQNIAQTLKSHGLKFISDVKDRKKSDTDQSSTNEGDKGDQHRQVEQENQVNSSSDHRKQQQEQKQQQQQQQLPRQQPHPLQQHQERAKSASQVNLDVNINVPQVTITSPSSPFLYPAGTATGPGGEPIVLLSPGIPGSAPLTPAFSTRPGSAAGSAMDGDANEDDDEFNLPVSLALFILFLYMFTGALIFTYTDEWHFWDSLYFVFISISTIGFGDLTPQSEWSMILLSIYLLFGLALTSMCINVIQEQLAVAFEQTKNRLGTRMGFDIEQLNIGQLEGGSDVEDTGNKGGTGGSGGGGKEGKDSSSSKQGTTQKDKNSNKDDSVKGKGSSSSSSSSVGRKKSVSVSETGSNSEDKNNNNRSSSNVATGKRDKNCINSSTGSQLSSKKVGKNSTSSATDTQSQSQSSLAAKASVTSSSPNNAKAATSASSTGFALKSESLGKNLRERREQMKMKPEQPQSLQHQLQPATNTNSFQASSLTLTNQSVVKVSPQFNLPEDSSNNNNNNSNSNSSNNNQLLQPVAPKRAKSPRRP